MYNKCCVPNCASKRKDVYMHKFPLAESLRNKWLEYINNDTLKSLNSTSLMKMLVCHNHFEKRFCTSKNGIKRTAYPTLFAVTEIINGIPQANYFNDEVSVISEHTYARKQRHFDHSYFKQLKPLQDELMLSPAKRMCKENLSECNLNVVPSTSTSEDNITDELIISPAKRRCKENMSESNLNVRLSKSRYENTTDELMLSPAKRMCKENLSDLNVVPSTSTSKDDTTETPKKGRRRLVHQKKNLTPRCRFLYKEYKKSRRNFRYNMQRTKAINLLKKNTLDEITKKMNPLAKTFVNMQIKMCAKNKKGRRFTLEEKLIALSILKQSPKTYKFLQNFFILPSNSTLKKMIAELDIRAGINTQVFEVIKKEVCGWDEKKRMCTIMFDEMALEPSLVYSDKRDEIHGFVELDKKSSNLADHALVFLVRGAVSKWQQPVAFYFTEGAVSSQQLQTILKKVTTAVIETGLIPVALVCDQGTTFQSAIKHMQEITRGDQICKGLKPDNTVQVSGASLSIVYDPPHLIKGIRNNFLTKNISSDGKIAKWQDIVDVYETDCKHTQSRLLHKLNDEHVIPKKVKKMKVKNCVRVFSKTVAGALSYTSEFSHYTDGKPVSKTLKNTSELISFLDDLFDSTNGTSIDYKRNKGKALRKAVTEKSMHHDFWKSAIKKLEKIKFVNNGREKSVPSLKNWITTIESYQRIWQVLRKKNVKVMRPRYFNSDPIENFFGRLRAYNFRNNNPTCHAFISTFKSLLITGLIKFHSNSFNCEDDACNQLIKVHSLFNKQIEDSLPQTNFTLVENPIIQSENFQAQASKERLIIHSRAYTAGWVIKKILKNIKCFDCETNLCTSLNATHKWITQREFKTLKEKKLTYPTENVVIHFGYVIESTNAFLENNAFKENIGKEIRNHILSKHRFDFINCKNHREDVRELFLNYTTKLCIYNWCKIINKILKGTDISRLDKYNLPMIQKKAIDKFKKKLKNRSFNK